MASEAKPEAAEIRRADNIDESASAASISEPTGAPTASVVRKPPREWFEKFQQRVDRAFAAQRG